MKLDDLYFAGRRMHLVTKFVDVLTRILKIKVCWGVMGEYLTKVPGDNRNVIAMRKMLASGRHCIWNHGWTHSEREFKYLTEDQAVDHLAKTQEIVHKRFGIVMDTFGAPWNSYNQFTQRAIERVKGIRNWFYGESSYQGTTFPFPFKMEVENFHPNFCATKRFIKALGKNRSAVLQAHPAYWGVCDAIKFALCMGYVKFRGYEFVFPHELSKEAVRRSFPHNVDGINSGVYTKFVI